MLVYIGIASCINIVSDGTICLYLGVLPFAKRGDDRGNNLIRLQQMFPRIVAAEFQQPLHVSKECQHLLSRMLTPDPARRITIGEIMQHSWCAPHLCRPSPFSSACAS